MLRVHRYPVAALLALGLSIAASACASSGYYGVHRDYRDFERRAYDNGYREGVKNGEHDAVGRREFRIDRDRDYRAADKGYYHQGGFDRERYRRVFRQGYEAGYAEGFDRVARQYGYGGRRWR